jgi:F0F1-type ATP synthase delta subunit
LNKKPKFEYEKNENIVAGYKVKAGDLQLDASCRSLLEDFKQTLVGEN